MNVRAWRLPLVVSALGCTLRAPAASAREAGEASPPAVDEHVAGAGASWERARLELQVEENVDGCPSQEEVALAIDQLAGRHFVAGDAPVVVRLSVSRVAHAGLHVLVTARTSSEVSWQVVRELTQPVSCAELLRAAALTVSLNAVQTPQRDEPEQAVPLGEERLRGTQGSSGETAPQGKQLEQTPPQREEPPRNDALLSEGVGAVPPPPPSRLPEDAAGASVPANPIVPARPRARLGVGAVVGWQVVPGWGVGGEAHAGVQGRHWAALIGISHARSTGSRPGWAPASQRVVAPVTDVWIAGCLAAVTTRFEVCAVGGHSWLAAEGRGFFVNRSDLVRTPWLGLQVGAAWPLMAGVATGPRLGVQVPLLDVELRVSGEERPFWELPPVGVRVVWAAIWR